MPADSKDLDEVRSVLLRYVEGYINADEDKLRDAFADDAVMNGYVGDRLVTGSPEPFIARVVSEPSLVSQGLELKYDIEQIAVTGNAASATLKEHGFGASNFMDYMHLIKREGAWKIISKTFSTF